MVAAPVTPHTAPPPGLPPAVGGATALPGNGGQSLQHRAGPLQDLQDSAASSPLCAQPDAAKCEPQGAFMSALRDLVAMQAAGALDANEFKAAKAKLLGICVVVVGGLRREHCGFPRP